MKDVTKIENMVKGGDYLTLYRVNYYGQRIYILPDPFCYFSGLTGAMEASAFKGDLGSKILDSWRLSMVEDLGREGLDDYMQGTATFGTLLHESLVTIKDQGFIDWSVEKDKAEAVFIDMMTRQNRPIYENTMRAFVYEYQKHVSSLMQFCYERVDEIHAIEVPVLDNDLGIATPVDITCTCRHTPKGAFKRTTLNMKTSFQITQHQLRQAAFELRMWNQTYVDEQCEATGILRTKKWRDGSKPTFELKCMTIDEAQILSDEMAETFELCKRTDASYYPNPKFRAFTGVTKIGDEPEITELNLETEWATWWKKQN